MSRANMANIIGNISLVYTIMLTYRALLKASAPNDSEDEYIVTKLFLCVILGCKERSIIRHSNNVTTLK